MITQRVTQKTLVPTIREAKATSVRRGTCSWSCLCPHSTIPSCNSWLMLCGPSTGEGYQRSWLLSDFLELVIPSLGGKKKKKQKMKCGVFLLRQYEVTVTLQPMLSEHDHKEC